MGFCGNCGATTEGDQHLCLDCGQPIEVPALVPAEALTARNATTPGVTESAPGAPSPSGRGIRMYVLALGLVLVALLGVGGYLWLAAGQNVAQVDPLPKFRAVMDNKGWVSAESEPSFWVAHSEYKLDSGGFVQLIKYSGEGVARSAQDVRAQQVAGYPGYSDVTSGTTRVTTTLMDASQANAGVGSIDVQFGAYRFEAWGRRAILDPLLVDLGYLDPDRARDASMTKFRAVIEASGITTATDTGHAARSAFTSGDFTADCTVFQSAEDALADFEATVKRAEAAKDEFKTSGVGTVRTLWLVKKYPDYRGKPLTVYYTLAYNGAVMTAVSGPVDSRATIDALMKELGY